METNLARWRHYLKDCNSPNSFIDASFYAIIGAALQRRVWVGPEFRPLFANTYNLLVGPPGVGKGMVIKPAAEFVREHKLLRKQPPVEANRANIAKVQDDVDKDVEVAHFSDSRTEVERLVAQHKASNRTVGNDPKTQADKTIPLLFPVAADATTYEALVNSIASCSRFINYKKYVPETGTHKLECYTHSSIGFFLEEVASLFRKNTNDTVNFLLQTYDCGDYEYDTIKRGKDRITRCCVNLLGGTTPGFLERIFDASLIDEGFSARTWFIYEITNRMQNLFYKELTTEQAEGRIHILNHIKKLSCLYGQVRYSPEAEAFLEHWFKNIHSSIRANTSEKLVPYYARKNIHIQKMAMLMHFADDAEMNDLGRPLNLISAETCQRALNYLNGIEKNMHYALNFNNRNPLYNLAKKIETYLKKNGKQTFFDLLLEFGANLREAELTEIMLMLTNTGKVVIINDNGRVWYDYNKTGNQEGEAGVFV